MSRAERPADSIAILSTIPRSGTWFLRYCLSFYHHLITGGIAPYFHSDNTANLIKVSKGQKQFDFRKFKGGPLLFFRDSMGIDYVFIGHTVCPGFSRIGKQYELWKNTRFHVSGYDYFNTEGYDYDNVPVDLATHNCAKVDVESLDDSLWRNNDLKIAFVYRNPLDQAISYYKHCLYNKDKEKSTIDGVNVRDISIGDYIFEFAIWSYARIFLSYQEMEKRFPNNVKILSYEAMISDPLTTIRSILSHIGHGVDHGTQLEYLRHAVDLSKKENIKKIEAALSRSLDGSQTVKGQSHIRGGRPGEWTRLLTDRDKERVEKVLESCGINIRYFDWGTDTNI